MRLRIALAGLLFCLSASAEMKGDFIPEDFSNFISGGWFLHVPEKENKGFTFRENGEAKDCFLSMADHGWDYGGLEIWTSDGYRSLEENVKLGARVKAAGLKVAVNLFYSDSYGRDIPEGWPQTFEELNQKVYDYTQEVLAALEAVNALPSMVKVGNEVDHADKGGFLLPVGKIYSKEFYALLKTGCLAVKDYNPQIKTMIHSYQGYGNNSMMNRCIKDSIQYDIYAVSYYPHWGGRVSRLPERLETMAKVGKRIMIIETGTPWTAHDFDEKANTDKWEKDGYFRNPASAHIWYQNLNKILNDHPLGAGTFIWSSAYPTLDGSTSTKDNMTFWNSETENFVPLPAEGMGRVNSIVSILSHQTDQYLTVGAEGILSAGAADITDKSRFEMVSLDSGYFALKSPDSGLYLTETDGQVEASEESLANAALWIPEDHNAGYEKARVALSIVSKSSGKSMSVDEKKNDLIVSAEKDLSSDGQRFYFEVTGSGVSSRVEDRKAGSHGFHLGNNYPNPFNPSTSIQYSLHSGDLVRLHVFDIRGRVVETLVDEYQEAGTYSVDFRTRNLPSGTYLYKLTAAGFSRTQKMLLIR